MARGIPQLYKTLNSLPSIRQYNATVPFQMFPEARSLSLNLASPSPLPVTNVIFPVQILPLLSSFPAPALTGSFLYGRASEIHEFLEGLFLKLLFHQASTSSLAHLMNVLVLFKAHWLPSIQSKQLVFYLDYMQFQITP